MPRKFAMVVLVGLLVGLPIASAESIHHNGAAVTTDLALDFEDGNGVTWTVTNDSANGRIKVAAAIPLDGWFPLAGSWSYASADGHTFTMTASGDYTSTLGIGTRLKLTQQPSLRYFIITAVAYASGTTTVTLYGGTDYTLANASISTPSYSTQKAPLGFPLDPTKWTEQVSSTVNQGQTNPVGGHWYSFTALSLDVPIGAWQLSNEAVAFASNRDVFVALSNTTATDSVSDADLIAYSETTATEVSATFHREKYVAQSAKTTWYLKLKVDQANVSQMNFGASTGAATVIRAVCAYL